MNIIVFGIFFGILISVESVPFTNLLNELPEEPTEIKNAFADFVSQYQKSYPSIDEVMFRYNVFKANRDVALILNEDSQKIGGAEYGVTKFSDLTKDEFKNSYLMRNMPPIPSEKLPPNNILPNVTTLLSQAPGSFDWWTQTGTETPIYDQGSCGSCWAFSATENLESRFARQHHQAAVEQSVQQILDCFEPQKYGCNGGWPYLAWEYIYSQGGQDALSCYPYTGQSGSCQFRSTCDVADLVSWTWIFPNQESQMAGWLYGNAPISACLDAHQWQYYRGGVVLGSQCTTNTDHCILLSGYNVNANPAYWNVRNSWGANWGESGFIRLQFGTNTCGLAQYPASSHTCNGC